MNALSTANFFFANFVTSVVLTIPQTLNTNTFQKVITLFECLTIW